jgi:hypothetical protein
MPRNRFTPNEPDNTATLLRDTHLPVTADIQFERDWQNAISGDELVKRVHRHIDQLYANLHPKN